MCLYTEDLIALVQLAAEVRWPSCQDEGDKDSLSVFSPDNVESQTCGAPVDQNSARLPDEEIRLDKIILYYSPTTGTFAVLYK